MRSRSSLVVFVLAIAALVPSLGVAQYTPKWHVGDWWIVKSWELEPHRGGGQWVYRRYDVAGIQKVGKNDCYVVEIRGSRRPNVSSAGAAGKVLYVRTDNWRLVRTVEARYSGGKRVAPDVFNYANGQFGPFVSEPRLPRFPLQLTREDTAFKLEKFENYCADLREISRPADPALVERLLAEGDTADTRVVRPSGVVYQVRNEAEGNVIQGLQPGQHEIKQSLQFWSDDLPWRAFEELVNYGGPSRSRSVTERSWLIAVGRTGK